MDVSIKLEAVSFVIIVTPYALHLVRMIPPVAVVMTIVQLTFPDTILTGTVAAIVNLILFACFQSNRIGRDALTELQNRSGFFDELSHYKRKGKNAHIVLVRLRNLEKINKRFGMKDGNVLLYNVARYLDNLELGYQVYRYGNTQFAMLGEFSTIENADEVAAMIAKRFESPWDVRGKEWIQRVQIVHMQGAGEELEANQGVERLNYMLVGKEKEENTVVYFDEEKKKSFERKSFVLNEVRKAIQKESFVLYYQPIYSCEHNEFKTAEVLLRMFTDNGELISPAEFIPIAEEYNLSDDITWIVLKKSMEYLAKHPELPLDSISVNMSIQQMNEKYLREKIIDSQKTFGALLYKLRIEITEDIIAQNPKVAAEIMRYITNEGAAFYLDDFGVGYSNFGRMFELPFEVIKLDRSLVKEIDKSGQVYQIIKSLVEMLHNAGFKVVAEGLETEKQVEKAKEIGVDRIQGFYYAKPMDGEKLLEFLQCEKK